MSYLTKKTPQAMATLKQMWREGASLGDIAAALDVSKPTIMKWAEQIDLPKRNRYELRTRRHMAAFGDITPFSQTYSLTLQMDRCKVLEDAAARRGISGERILRRIINTVIQDNMIDAVLDDDAVRVEAKT